MIGRILLKTALLLVALNLLFAWLNPLEPLGRVSFYNRLFPGRERLPYGENPAESYNLSLNNVPAMLASQRLDAGQPDDAFNVLVVGDSGTWGWFLENDDTLTGQLNEMALTTAEGQPVHFINLGYPIMSLTKDLMLMDAAISAEIDLVIWLVTLESFPRDKQLFAPIVQNNPDRVRALIERYDLAISPDDPQFVDPTFAERTLFGQRRPLADLLRLQSYGVAWGATGIDQTIPAEIPLRQSDFEADESWQDFDEPTELSADDLAFDVLAAGVARSAEADIPILIINEPIYVSSGTNSDLRYNSWYPRWAYDQYRELISAEVAANEWDYLEWWDALPPDVFTDSPVHVSAEGTQLEAELLAPIVLDYFTQ